MRFRLVDEIHELAPGRSVRASATLGPDEEIFGDHFPGFPVVPGVILTEMMAQAAGKCLVAEDRARGRPMLVQIKSATFRDFVRPGEQVQLDATVLASRPQFARVSATAHVEARLVASAELMFAFQPVERFADEGRDEVLERFLARASSRDTAGKESS